ncbi:MAG: hypothetical protein AAGI53_04665 [Planctomycetota bacterium]
MSTTSMAPPALRSASALPSAKFSMKSASDGATRFDASNVPICVAPGLKGADGFALGGVDWAQWAITTEDNENFTFPTTGSFVNWVQLGVHGTPNMRLPRSGVLVSPRTLLEIGGPQLSNLVSFEGSDEDNGVARESLLGILQHTGIVALEAISSGLEFLSQLDIVDAPIFQVLDLGDRLALHALVAHLPVQAALDKGLQKLASESALDRARSVLAFADPEAIRRAPGRES